MPLQQFKANQAKATAKLFSDSLNSAILSQQKISEISASAHFASSGLFFTSEDRDNVQMPTQKFRDLVQMAEESTKAVVLIRSLNDDLKKVQAENARLNSDFQFLLHKFNQLEESTSSYSDIPTAWRKVADSQIDALKQTFTQYCHEVNRLTLKVFIANNGNFDETEKLMRLALKYIGVKDTRKYISNVIRSATIQLKRNEPPALSKPSWHPPKPSQTDYSQPCNPQALDISDVGKIVDLRLDTIDWDLINWNLLSVFDKAEIQRKKIIREL